jgi:flagellar hook protein FlgE
MNTLTSISLSGMGAAALQVSASAHNIANESTPGFRRQQVVQQTQEGGGVSGQLMQAAATGHALEADLVQQRVALYSFKASLQAVQVQDEMLGSLLDVRA